MSESLDQNESNGYGFRIYAIASIQNGAPDGVALVDDGTPVQFLSYEGSFEATDGPLVGVLSTDIGVAEPGDTPVGHSLQLGGTGDTYGDFANGSWQAAAAETPGLVNTGQTFSATVLPNATCPADFAITEGDGAIKALSASDADGTVVDISAVTVPDPSGHIHVTDLVAASGVGATATANLTVDGGGDVPAGVYEVEITATNDDGSPEIGTCSVTITVYPTELTPVYDIQGDGSDSPLEGEWVRTFGVVTAEFQTVGGGGFFLQDPDGDADTDTSDGIFVEADDPFGVSAGAMVEVLGFVEENFGQTQITDVQEVLINGADAVAATAVVPPFQDAMEKYEGMLVSFADKLYVSDNFNLHRRGEIWLTAGGAPIQPSDEIDAGTTAMHDLAEMNIENTIGLDDGASGTPDPIPFIHGAAPGTLRIGDYTDDLVGVVTYSFGNFEIWPTDVSFDVGNPRPAVPDVGGDVKIGGFNVLNYWTTLGERGAGDAGQLAAQTSKLVDAIRGLGAAVVALQEVENDAAHLPITTLVAALNDAETGSPWSWIGELDYYNAYVIRNEIIYRNDRVVPYGDPVTIADAVFDTIPDGRDNPLGRPPIAQTFMYGLEKFTVVSVHLKSKSSSVETGADEDQSDGQAAWNATRVLQAAAVLDFVDDIVADTGDPDVIVMGDMNAYMEEDPIYELETELVNLLKIYDEDGWSYQFFPSFAWPFAGRGNLDHAFATWDASFKVTGAAAWNINADEPRYLDWFDPTTLAPNGFRSSDHDPILVGLAAPGADFTDIAESIFIEDILFIAALGVTFGCNPPTNDEYCPDRQLTVGELAAMVRRAIDAPDTDNDYFTDDETSTFEGDLNALADIGVSVPCGEGLACPDDYVSRKIAAAMGVLAFALPGTGTDYFVDDEASLYEDAINAFREALITYGCNPPTNDEFCPTVILTRGMIAAFIHRAALLGYLSVI